MMPASTRAGVVRLNLGDAAQARTAYAEILASAKAYAPQARITRVSVQEMLGDGVEVIIGGVAFAKAVKAFSDPFVVEWIDQSAAYGDERWSLLGVCEGVILHVTYTERGGRPRA